MSDVLSATGDVKLAGLRKVYGDFVAVHNLDLVIPQGSFFALLGPSGCGKTTTLRMIAGLDEPTSGQVLIGNTDITSTKPYQRPVNTVFQNYALFPHMDIFENVAFGLRRRGEKNVDKAVNAGIEVDRGSSANVSLLWNESSDKWTFTNDGTTYYDIADAARLDSSFTHANSAFNQANTATTTSGLAYNHANGAFDKANTATTTAGLAYTHADGAFDKANTVATTAQNAYDLANGTAGIANTDYTTVSVTAATYGNATYVPTVTLASNGRVTSVTTTAISAGASIGDVLALSIALG